MYVYNSRIRYTEIDRTGRLSTEAIINYFQDTTNFHSESAGLSWDVMLSQNRAWLLSFWKVFIDEQRPGFGEEISVETRPYAYDGLFGRRGFVMRGSDGREIATADSMWFLFDSQTGHPAVNEPQFIEPYGVDEPFDMDRIKRRHISLPKEMTALEPFAVRKDVLDTNYHVNNCRYIAMAEEYFPEGRPVTELQVEYKLAAKYGDIVHPRIADSGDGYRYISLDSADGDVYAALKVR